MRPFDVKLPTWESPGARCPSGGVRRDQRRRACRRDQPGRGLGRPPGGSGSPPSGTWPSWTSATRVAQKLHELTSGGDRVRDLVDLQLIMGNADVDLARTRPGLREALRLPEGTGMAAQGRRRGGAGASSTPTRRMGSTCCRTSRRPSVGQRARRPHRCLTVAEIASDPVVIPVASPRMRARRHR